MGIPGLWDILGDGEITTVAKLAAEHFQRTGGALKVAVDEAGWRFQNLTAFQVAKIREAEPAANPIEKAIFFRLTKLLRLNVRLLFVFDGPGRPWKRNRKGGSRVDYEETRLLKKMLDMLKVPYHHAPAEAEAECARLQQEKVVDAVWSEDGDTLMFGCGLLIREYRVNNKKSDTHIRVYRSSTIQTKLGLNREGLVLFALLSGGDYDTVGLRGCGPQLALKAAQHGLGRSLCQVTSERELPLWRMQLVDFVKSKAIDVPPDYPRWLHVKNYSQPKVSDVEDLHDLRGLRRGWDLEIDQAKLRGFVRETFNIWTRGYIKHVVQFLLVKQLARTVPGKEAGNARLDIKMCATRKKKIAPDDGDPLEKKITFLPLEVVNINISTQPEQEDWTVFKSKEGVPYNPAEPAETKILECLLRNGLPESVFSVMEPPPKITRKRKLKASSDDPVDPSVVQDKYAKKRQKSNIRGVANVDIPIIGRDATKPPSEHHGTDPPSPSQAEADFLKWFEEESIRFQNEPHIPHLQLPRTSTTSISISSRAKSTITTTHAADLHGASSTAVTQKGTTQPVVLDLTLDTDDDDHGNDHHYHHHHHHHKNTVSDVGFKRSWDRNVGDANANAFVVGRFEGGIEVLDLT